MYSAVITNGFFYFTYLKASLTLEEQEDDNLVFAVETQPFPWDPSVSPGLAHLVGTLYKLACIPLLGAFALILDPDLTVLLVLS